MGCGSSRGDLISVPSAAGEKPENVFLVTEDFGRADAKDEEENGGAAVLYDPRVVIERKGSGPGKVHVKVERPLSSPQSFDPQLSDAYMTTTAINGFVKEGKRSYILTKDGIEKMEAR